MTYTQATKFAQELRRFALEAKQTHEATTNTCQITVLHGAANSFEYRINGVLFSLRQFEQALMLLETIPHPADELLRRALAALNTKARFNVPSLETHSYAIAAEIDAYLRAQQHPHIGTGLCKVCGHYGDDCTGIRGAK